MDAGTARLSGHHILLSAEYLHFGGTRTYLLRLLDLYYRQGAQVTLVSTLLEADPGMQAFLEGRQFRFQTFPDAMAMGGYARKQGHPTVWSLRQYSKERDAFRNFAARIGATRSVVSVGTAGLLLSAAAALPDSIVIAHGYPHGRRQELFGRRYLSRLIPQKTTFISVSNFEQRTIKRLWDLELSGSQIVTVPSTDGIPTKGRSTSQPPWSVLTASMVEPYKRPYDWIEVADKVIGRLPFGSVEFTWLGEGSLLEAARSDAGLRKNAAFIHFPGLSLDPEPEYRSARVYVQLSAVENLSLSTLDAQRHGIPCVVTEAGGFPEIITNDVNGFVVPTGDVNAAVQAICKLLEDPILWDLRARASQELYELRFTPNIWEEGILRAHGA